MRRAELLLIIAFVLAMVVAAIIGIQGAPSGADWDRRLSTYLTGRHGALALALAIEKLGTPVEQSREPLFDLAEGTVDTTQVLALLDPTVPPSESELLALRRYVRAGGRLFIAAGNLTMNCFGVAIGRPSFRHGPDSIPLAPHVDIGHVPAARSRLALITDSLRSEDPSKAPWMYVMTRYESSECRLTPTSVDTTLVGLDSIPVAMNLGFAGGGRVLVLADPRYLSNEVLRESDAGALVIPWLLAGAPDRVVFDEYHHGFGRNRSLWLAAGSWLLSNPAGWVILQLSLTALIALAAAAVRFGPALHVVERRRRSALEHVDALASGLERAKGGAVAIGLIIEGLRRRLGRGVGPRAESTQSTLNWLDTLTAAAGTPAAAAARERLVRLAGEGDGDQAVLEAAQTVETLWNELGR